MLRGIITIICIVNAVKNRFITFVVMLVLSFLLQSVSFQLSLDHVMLQYSATSTTHPQEGVKSLHTVAAVATVTTLKQWTSATSNAIPMVCEVS